jgi:hypothetical protein
MMPRECFKSMAPQKRAVEIRAEHLCSLSFILWSYFLLLSLCVRRRYLFPCFCQLFGVCELLLLRETFSSGKTSLSEGRCSRTCDKGKVEFRISRLSFNL